MCTVVIRGVSHALINDLSLINVVGRLMTGVRRLFYVLWLAMVYAMVGRLDYSILFK